VSQPVHVTRLKKPRPIPRWWREAQFGARNTLVLFRQFRGPLLGLAAVILGGGVLYYVLSQSAQEPTRPSSLAEALYGALSMMFLQAGSTFPNVWYLQLFYFVMPLLGLVILGQGAADFAVLLFNRQARGEAWEVAVAETYANHIIIIGLGHLGFRIAHALHDLAAPFVIIEKDPEAELVAQAQSWNVPIIRGDALKQDTLRKARADRAQTVVIATSDDTMNLQIAIHARAVNPQVRTIVRLFDDDFAREVRQAFGVTAAYSASALAAPAFAASAAGLETIQSVTLNDRTLHLSQFTLGESSPLVGESVANIEDHYDLTIVLLRHGREVETHPNNQRTLKAADQITVFADADTLRLLKQVCQCG
jgi:voltage-gated potassium channel